MGSGDGASDEYVGLEVLSNQAQSLVAQRHVGLCQLAQAVVLTPHDLRGALDLAKLAETRLRRLGAMLEADRAGELVAELTIRDRARTL
ncbi:hypothetical protein PPSIR1_18517 [Plesiocystis pacifica SIR-1]|uniref:Uncharacterized protein n=1 Tax=Plesiocystis pacifica SIR-1 TaxID=391625 RepID=A6GCR2_9BACT|nr:hypothetical protein [Plesiocystis pacifica]EDM76328.1 hypothetical protein PPSIR1_18517 [Plesiocystis pacifica SIR-1]